MRQHPRHPASIAPVSLPHQIRPTRAAGPRLSAGHENASRHPQPGPPRPNLTPQPARHGVDEAGPGRGTGFSGRTRNAGFAVEKRKKERGLAGGDYGNVHGQLETDQPVSNLQG